MGRLVSIVSQFHVYLPWDQRPSSALVGAFSVIVKTICETDGSFYSTSVQARARGGSVSGVMCDV